jgi:hypothetical protein
VTTVGPDAAPASVKVEFFSFGDGAGHDQVELIMKDAQASHGASVTDDFTVNDDTIVLVTYQGKPGSSYTVSVTGDPLCDATIVRKNPKCDAGKRCIGNPFTKDGVCLEATAPTEHCVTSKSGDDECADGSFCKFDQQVEDDDDGPNGVCTPCSADAKSSGPSASSCP